MWTDKHSEIITFPILGMWAVKNPMIYKVRSTSHVAIYIATLSTKRFLFIKLGVFLVVAVWDFEHSGGRGVTSKERREGGHNQLIIWAVFPINYTRMKNFGPIRAGTIILARSANVFPVRDKYY